MTTKEAIKELMGRESISMAISALQSQQTGGWISVNDALPKHMTEYVEFDRLNLSPQKAIILRYAHRHVKPDTLVEVVRHVKSKLKDNVVIAIPEDMYLESYGKKDLENMISVISKVIDLL